MKFLLFVLACLALVFGGEERVKAGKADIYWDVYGVPHVFADSLEALSYGFGYAHGRDQGRQVVQLVFFSFGRAAELGGFIFAPVDRYLYSLRLPQLAQTFYEAQDKESLMIYDAFAAGFNAYCEEHPEEFDGLFSVVLPVSGMDIFRANLRVLYSFAFANSGDYSTQFKSEFGEDPLKEERTRDPGVTYSVYEDLDPLKFLGVPDELRELIGSNGWAINSKSGRSDGKPKLNMNPHLPYQAFFRWYEAQLVCEPCGINVSGANLVGIPNLQIAFNEYIGWTHTVNPGRPHTGYVVELADENSYYYDGEILPITKEEVTFKIKLPIGSRRETVVNEFTHHGQIVARADGKVAAKRLAGFDDTLRPDAVKQWWDMGRSKNMKEFKDSMRQLQVPMFYTIVASIHDDILFNFNGWVPERSVGDWDYWLKAVNGSTSETFWTSILPWDELPTIENPESGYVQNANEAPWSATLPVFTLNPKDYAPYVTRQNANCPFRCQVSMRMMESNKNMTFERFRELKHSTAKECAEHALDDLLEAVKVYGSSDLVRQAAEVLSKWDRQMDNTSRGADLFSEWQGINGNIFVNQWNPEDPLETPNTLVDPERSVRDLETAANNLLNRGIALDSEFGENNRLFSGSFISLETLPGNGCDDCFRNSRFFKVNLGGDSYVAIVEWDEETGEVRAESLIGYGNASPGSAGAEKWGHVNDQNALYSKKQLKPVWRKLEDILKNLEEHVSLEF